MPSIAAAKGKKTRLECITPVLSVKSVPASIDYYVKVLGFKKDWDDGDMASVSPPSQPSPIEVEGAWHLHLQTLMGGVKYCDS